MALWRREEELHCVFSTVCQREGHLGGAVAHCPQLSHMASHGAGGSHSDTRDTNCWLTEARSGRCTLTLHWRCWHCLQL